MGKADHTSATSGLGQNGYSADDLGRYSVQAALVFEAVMTFIFVTVILGAMAGIAIGLTRADA